MEMGTFDEYQPNQEVLRQLEPVPLIGVVGISGAGKTTLMQHAIHDVPGLYFAISDTSRAPRGWEVDGQDYYFRDLAYMEEQARAGKYATVAPSAMGDLYATRPQEYTKEGQPMLAVLSSVMPQFERTFPNMLPIAIVPPSYEIWNERLVSRGVTGEQYAKRMVEARESLAYILDAHDLLCVINDDMATAKRVFTDLITGKRRESRIEVERQQAKQIAATILARL